MKGVLVWASGLPCDYGGVFTIRDSSGFGEKGRAYHTGGSALPSGGKGGVGIDDGDRQEVAALDGGWLVDGWYDIWLTGCYPVPSGQHRPNDGEGAAYAFVIEQHRGTGKAEKERHHLPGLFTVSSPFFFYLSLKAAFCVGVWEGRGTYGQDGGAFILSPPTHLRITDGKGG